MVDGIHPDPVTEQGAARLSLGRVHGDDGNTLVVKIHQKTTHQLIYKGRFARSTGTGNPQYWDRCCLAGGSYSRKQVCGALWKILKCRDDPCDGPLVSLS